MQKRVTKMILHLKYPLKIIIGILLGCIAWTLWNFLEIYFPTLPNLDLFLAWVIFVVASLLFIPVEGKVEMETVRKENVCSVEVRSISPLGKVVSTRILDENNNP